MARNSWSSIQNINNWSLRILNYKFIRNLRNLQPYVDNIYLYAEDIYEGKYQLLINKRESSDLKHLNGSNSVIEYSNDTNDIHKNIEEQNPNKKHKILIVYGVIIIDMLSNLTVTKLIIRGRKLNISFVFIA